MQAAAIEATYADYRRVKGRKVLQIILEVPLEKAQLVHDAFGEPSPDGSTWVAVARLNMNTATEPKKGGRLSKKAALLCQTGAFRKFLNVTAMGHAETEDEAAFILRRECGIQSRAELDHDESAAKRFDEIESAYVAWMEAA